MDTLQALRLGDQEDEPVWESDGSRRDTVLSTTERSGSQRLFLFSKKALSESSPSPAPCVLQPLTLHLPTEPNPSPLIFPSPSSPLHQALEVYERRFMLHLCRGRALADGADLRLASCRSCAEEQTVMAKALRAAVSNLSDHRNSSTKTRTEFSAVFGTRTAQHASLLARFESLLTALGDIRLDPALVSVARSSGRVMETLLDTVPVERERAWKSQCEQSHERLMALYSELERAFGELGTNVSREEESRRDLEAEDVIKQLWNKIEGPGRQVRDRQAQRLDQLTRDHGNVVKVVMNVISNDGGAAQAAFTTLEEMTKASANILPSMETDDGILLGLMKSVADNKTQAMHRMKARLREVSTAQSTIQRVLSSATVVRDALNQQSENMIHLEHIAELPASYRDFLSELRRRRAYGAAVMSSCSAMMDRLATMRTDEVKQREKFLRGPGRHLMPAFFEIFVPTLATPPPLFTPQLPSMVEMDTLPDVRPPEAAPSDDSQMKGHTPVPPEEGAGVSSASTLTGDDSQQHVSTMSTTSAVRPKGQESQQQQRHVIVSGDEGSGNALIMEASVAPNDDVSAEAERKTLEYENAVLRQALERMGEKPPRAYIEEAADHKSSTIGLHQTNRSGEDEQKLRDDLVLVRGELDRAKQRLKDANQALIDFKRQDPKHSDKISHSSFEVGDIGLFMPTGLSYGGYVAFHTKCPHHYLSTDSIDGKPNYVLGRIVYQEELIAAGASGTDSNPYGLPAGTKFWVLTVEVLNSPKKA